MTNRRSLPILSSESEAIKSGIAAASDAVSMQPVSANSARIAVRVFKDTPTSRIPAARPEAGDYVSTISRSKFRQRGLSIPVALEHCNCWSIECAPAAGQSPAMLSIRKLCKSFHADTLGEHVALERLSPQLRQGECTVVVAQGINVRIHVIVGLGVANLIAVLGDTLLAQNQGFADVNMGFGTLIGTLALLLPGEAILGNCCMRCQVLAPVTRSVVYYQLISAVLAIAFRPFDLKMVTALFVLLTLVIAMKRKDGKARPSRLQ